MRHKKKKKKKNNTDIENGEGKSKIFGFSSN